MRRPHILFIQLMAEKPKEEYQWRAEAGEGGKKQRGEQKDKSYNRWKETENYAYITYLQVCRPVLQDSSKRKTLRIFRHLSRLITTRTHQQIKSHHQKMMRKYGCTEQILRRCKRQIREYAASHPAHRLEIENLTPVILQFFKEQNHMKKFSDLNIVASWKPDFKSHEDMVKVEEHSQQIMVEQDGLSYILYHSQDQTVKQEQDQPSPQHSEAVKQQDSE